MRNVNCEKEITATVTRYLLLQIIVAIFLACCSYLKILKLFCCHCLWFIFVICNIVLVLEYVKKKSVQHSHSYLPCSTAAAMCSCAIKCRHPNWGDVLMTNHLHFVGI